MIKEYYHRIRLVAIHMDIHSKVLTKMNQCKYLKKDLKRSMIINDDNKL